MKPAITTFTLLAANVLLLSYILLIDRHQAVTGAGGGRLLQFEHEAVAKVVFHSAEGAAEVVKHEDGSWRFVAPFEDRFSPTLMAELLKYAGELRINSRISPKEIKRAGWGDSYFGFDDNAVGLELFDAAGASLGAVELGTASPYQNTVYARLRGEGYDRPVSLTWSYLRDIVTQPLSELRDRRLVFAKANEIFRVKFHPPRPAPVADFEVHVERAPGGQWRMEKPFQTRCDQKLVNELVAKLVKLEVAEFVDEPGADLETAFDNDKRYEIMFRKKRAGGSENSELTTIEFGKVPTDDSDPYVLAKVSGRKGLFLVDKRVHYEFGMDGDTLRDRTLADFEYDAVTSVRIKRLEKEEIYLERIGDAWVIHRDPDDPAALEAANSRMVKDLIARINDEEVEFEDEAPADLELYGLKDPAIEVTIKRGYTDPNEVVEKGKLPTLYEKVDVLMLGVGFKNQPAGEAFAAFRGENYVYKISPVLPGAINRDGPLGYKTLQLWPRFTAFDFRKVTIHDKLSGPPLEIEFEYGTNLWRVIRDGIDVTKDIDRVVLDGFLQYLGRPPRGKNWTLRTLRSDDRLKDPDLELTIDLVDPRDQRTPHTIKFRASSTVPGAQLFYGRVNQSPDVLVLDAQTIRAMSLPLLRLSKPR